VSHDLLLRLYLDTDESKELGEAFRGKRTPDSDKFGH
jgi:naphthoate synthase